MARRRRLAPPASAAGLASGGLVVLLWAMAPEAWREPTRERALDVILGIVSPWRDWSAAPPVVIAAIDPKSLEAIGAWPWRRETIGSLVAAIDAADPAAVAVDILLAGTDTRSPAGLARRLGEETGRPEFEALAATLVDGDALLASAISAGPVALGWVLDPRGDDDIAAPPVLVRDGARLGPLWSADGVSGPPALLAEAASGAGTLSLPGDQDGVVRRVPLMVAVHGIPRPSLALEALRIAAGASGYFLSGDPPMLAIGEAVGRLPPNGLLRLVPTRGDVPRISAADLVAGRGDTAALAGAIVLIGGTAPELGALRPSPADPLTPSSALNAAAIRQYAAGIVPVRPATATITELAVATALTLASVWLARTLRPLAAAAAFIIGGAATATGAVLLAAYDVLLDPVPALTAGAIAFAVAATLGYAETRRREARLRLRFSQHLAPGVVERIVANPDSVRLTGERRDVTSMFTDIEGFSTLTRSIGPEALVKILDGYFEGVASLVASHGGMVDKFIGDAVHAIFNAPLDLPDHPMQAVVCARAILAWTEAHRTSGLAREVGLGRTRIGIETGEAVVGDVGIGMKLDYTAHGDVVNTAARLEALNKELGTSICIGPGTAARCREGTVRPLGTAELRGIGVKQIFTVW